MQMIDFAGLSYLFQSSLVLKIIAHYFFFVPMDMDLK